MALWRRGPCSAQGLASGSMYAVCCMVCSAVVFWLFCPSGKSSADALLTWYTQCLVSGLNVTSFSYVCSVLLVKRELTPLPPELRSSRTCWWGDMLWAGGYVVLLGQRPASMGLRHARAQGHWAWCKQVRQPSVSTGCFLRVALCLCWGSREGNGTSQLLLLFLESSLHCLH